MTAKDPQTTVGTGAYVPLGRCLTDGCGHSEAVHRFGTRRGVKVRTACSAYGCVCALYFGAPDPVSHNPAPGGPR